MRFAAVSVWVGVMLVTSGLSAAPRANPGFVLAVTGALPFDLPELAYAVSARVTLTDDPGESAGTIEVESAGPDLVSVTLGDRSRVVKLGKKTGAAAARVVALIVSDLVIEHAELEPLPPDGSRPSDPKELPPGGDDATVDPYAPDGPGAPGAGDDGSVPGEEPAAAPKPTKPTDGTVDEGAPAKTPAKPAAMVDAGDGALLASAARPRPGRSRNVMAVLMPGLGVGLGNDEPLTGSLDLGMLFPSPLGRALVSAAVVHTPTTEVSSGWQVSMTSATMRATLGTRMGLLAAYVGPFWTVYQLDGHGFGSLLGTGGRALLTAPVGGRFSFVLAGGFDIYFNRVDVQIGGETAFATPRFGTSIALGLGVDFR